MDRILPVTQQIKSEQNYKLFTQKSFCAFINLITLFIFYSNSYLRFD